MKHLKAILATGILTAILPITANAGIMDGWTGEAGISGSKTSGNTDTTDVGVAINLNKAADIWTHKFDTTYDYGTADGLDSKNRLFLGYQLDREINDQLYVYGNTNYFTDDFGPYKQGAFVGAGLGYKVWVDEPALWSVEGGAGLRSQKTRALNNLGSIREEEFALRGASDFDYKLNDAVSFYNDTEVIYSKSDTYIWNDIGLTAKLAGNFAAKFGVRVDHHTDVPVGVEQTDTITRGSLVYTIN